MRYSILLQHADGLYFEVHLKHKCEAYALQQALRFTNLDQITLYEDGKSIQIDYSSPRATMVSQKQPS